MESERGRTNQRNWNFRHLMMIGRCSMIKCCDSFTQQCFTTQLQAGARAPPEAKQVIEDICRHVHYRIEIRMTAVGMPFFYKNQTNYIFNNEREFRQTMLRSITGSEHQISKFWCSLMWHVSLFSQKFSKRCILSSDK
jgi:hypothetical protein